MSLFSKKAKYNYELVFRKLMSQLETLDSSSEHVEEMIRSILGIVHADSGSLFLYHDETRQFVLNKWVGEKPLHVSIEHDYEFLLYVRQIQNVLFKDEIIQENRYVDIRSSGIHYFTQIACQGVIPLMLKNRWIGILNIGKPLKEKAFDEEDRSILLLIGYWFGHHISNLTLFSQIKAQNKKLAEITELKNQLMANVTHELRTPLNGILGLTDLIYEGSDGPITEDQKRHLGMIKEAGNSLLDIVNNILSLIKVEASRGEIEIRRLDLSRMVEEVAALFEGINAANQNEFLTSVAGNTTVFGDEDQIRTVLMNLVGNAAKFTKNGRIEVTAQRSGEMVRVVVRDTGIGISEEDQHKIFEEFRQANGSITRSYGGTGLGLTIAKKIIELHGGRIWVDSILGKGAEFCFTLPIRPGKVHVQELN
ncbi:GAF domain-containing protein [bacterium]|nr:GAF domain-containing protein [bacterium]